MKRTTAGLLSYEFGKFRFFMNANDFAMLRRFSCVRSLNHRPLISRRQRYRPRVAKAEWLSSRVPLNFDRAAGTAAQRIGPRAERPIFFKFNEPNETPQILRRERRRRKKETQTSIHVALQFSPAARCKTRKRVEFCRKERKQRPKCDDETILFYIRTQSGNRATLNTRFTISYTTFKEQIFVKIKSREFSRDV